MRRHFPNLAFTLLLTLGFSLLVLPTANAYIDPGSGSLIFQAVVGALMAGGLLFKTQWRRLKGLVTRSKTEEEEGA